MDRLIAVRPGGALFVSDFRPITGSTTPDALRQFIRQFFSAPRMGCFFYSIPAVLSEKLTQKQVRNPDVMVNWIRLVFRV